MRALGIAELTILALAAPAAFGDVLVLEDGARLETRGPWEVRGAVVVFTDQRGTLTSIRSEEVDLEASRAATEGPPAEPPAEEEVPPRRPALVLTDQDVPAAPRAPAAAAGSDAAEEGAEEADGEPPGLVVEEWEKIDPEDLGGVVVRGTLANRGEHVMSELRLGVRVFDHEGELLDEGEAFLTHSVLEGRGATSFRIPFEGVYDFARVEFDISGLEFMLGVADMRQETGKDLGGE